MLRSGGTTMSVETLALTVLAALEATPSLAVTVKLAVLLALLSLTNTTEPAASCAAVKLVIAEPGRPCPLSSATWPLAVPVTEKLTAPSAGRKIGRGHGHRATLDYRDRQIAGDHRRQVVDAERDGLGVEHT